MHHGALCYATNYYEAKHILRLVRFLSIYLGYYYQVLLRVFIRVLLRVLLRVFYLVLLRVLLRLYRGIVGRGIPKRERGERGIAKGAALRVAAPLPGCGRGAGDYVPCQ